MLNLFISIALALVSTAAAIHALTTKSDSRSALAWVSFCLLMPLLGPIAYLLLGINRTRSTAQRLYSSKPTLEEGEPVPLSERHSRAMIGQRGVIY